MRKSGRAQPDPTRTDGGWAPQDRPLPEQPEYEPKVIDDEGDRPKE